LDAYELPGSKWYEKTLAQDLDLDITVNTAIEFTATSAKVWGGNAVVIFDGRFASYALGTNGAISGKYVLLDTYVEGDAILP
jgi:hypothetical protein